MTVESREETVRNVFNDWVFKTTNNEGRVMDVTKDWRTIKLGCRMKNRPFGEFKTNVWNHEWCDQFRKYEMNEEWNESNSLTSNRSFWDEEITSLVSKEREDFETEEEFSSRLDKVKNLSIKYN